MSSARTRTVVIGGGLIGCSIALELARRGHAVTVIERLAGVGQGSTSKSTAIIRQLYHERHSIKLAIEGLRTWEMWSDHVGHRENLVPFHQPGILWVLKPEMMAAQPVKTLKELGADVETLEEAALQKRFPSFRFTGPLAGAPVAGLFEKRGGWVEDPTRAVENLAEAAHRAGVTFRHGEEVVRFEHDTGAGGRRRVVAATTDAAHRIEGDVFVNAAGPHSARVNELAGSPLPLATAPNRQRFVDGRETSLSRPGLSRDAFPVCADPVLGMYFRPDAERFRVGTVLPEHDREFVADPDAPLPDPDEEFVQSMLDRVRRRQPDSRLVAIRPGQAFYDVTVADWCPILDKTDVDGWFVAIGTSGKWFKSGPVIGWIMAELIQWVLRGHDPDQPHDRLSIRLPRTGHELALADFARWRVPHRTGGVLA
jgi:sarcosine oxidase subunit beta